MPPFDAIGRAVAAQRGHLLCWAPVFLGLGIGLYFALPAEPGPWGWAALAAGFLLALGAVFGPRRWRLGENGRPLAGALALVALGALLAGARAQMVAAPVLGFRYYGPLEGRIVAVDRSGSDAVRLTLDRVVMADMAPARTPARVRVSLHGRQGFVTVRPGLRVMMTANLSRPAGPVEPGGFDFRRKAWFDRLGAVGYTRTPVLAAAPEDGAGTWGGGAGTWGGAGLALYRARLAISDWVRARMPGDAGAFAAAVMAGDRSAMGREVVEDLRASNLSHLLAISGLHMGLVTGFVFAALRLAMALVPRLALRWPVKKIAAVAALLAGAFYLALSGGNVATQRAFVMVSVMFVAVVFDKRAVTLRAVAVAALIVLVLRPEALAGPGFQMSFAATVALVAVFGWLRGWPGKRLPGWARAVLAVVISSAVAGAATAPIAAAFFNRFSNYGLLANLLAVPLMGLVVMPGAVLSALLWPLGLGWVALAVMRPAIDWILGVAHWVAGLEGALTHVPTPPGGVLPLMALGGLWIVLWQGRRAVRLAGVLPVAAALAIWLGAERPAVLISDSGRLVGVLTGAGRVLNKPRGDGFAARIWLENDGDGADQAGAYARAADVVAAADSDADARRAGNAWAAGGAVGLVRGKGRFEVRLGRARIVQLSGRGAAARLPEVCAQGAALVVISVRAPAPEGCEVYGPSRLARTGALALGAGPDGRLQVISAQALAGDRPWTGGRGWR